MYPSGSRSRLALTVPAALLALSGLAPDAAPAAQAEDAGSAPVVGIIAPVLDIVTATSDPGGVVTDKESPAQVKLVLDATVLFAKDSAALTPRARSVLAGVAERLRQVSGARVRIVGYTDDLGSAQHGLVLSRQRADAVARVLRPHLAGRRLTVQGMGEADFVAPNTSEANRRKNRRVEITVST